MHPGACKFFFRDGPLQHIMNTPYHCLYAQPYFLKVFNQFKLSGPKIHSRNFFLIMLIRMEDI